jgi:hypothetical protein
MAISDAGFFDLIQHKDVAGALEALAERPALAGARDAYLGSTPQHFAAGEGHLDVVRVLIGAGADRSARDTACHAPPAGWAEFAGHAEIAALLSE